MVGAAVEGDSATRSCTVGRRGTRTAARRHERQGPSIAAGRGPACGISCRPGHRPDLQRYASTVRVQGSSVELNAYAAVQ